MYSIELKNIKKNFGRTPVLKAINLAIKDGEFLTLVGPSGCGKSTLLQILAGLESQDEGDVIINNKIVNNIRASHRNLAMVFQTYALYPHLTVQQNLAVPLKLRSLTSAERNPFIGPLFPTRKRKLVKIQEKIIHTSEILQISHLLGRKPAQLSGGQQQRVALGRAMVREPSAFLMDEPLSNLDAALRVHMRTELSQLHRQLKTTFVYVTHDQAEALTMSDRMAVMMNGKILQIDTPDQIYQNPLTLEVAEFIGSPKINIAPAEYDTNGHLTCLGVKISFSTAMPEQKNVKLGIRPEHFEILPQDAKIGFLADVQFKENMGSDIYLHFKTNYFEQFFIVRCSPEKARFIAVGDRIRIRWIEEKILIFGSSNELVSFKKLKP